MDIHVHIHSGEVEEGRAPTKRKRSTTKKAATPEPKTKPRKLSAWQRYMKVKKNQIKFKSGDRKGMLNLKAMSKKFKRGKKK